MQDKDFHRHMIKGMVNALRQDYRVEPTESGVKIMERTPYAHGEESRVVCEIWLDFDASTVNKKPVCMVNFRYTNKFPGVYREQIRDAAKSVLGSYSDNEVIEGNFGAKSIDGKDMVSFLTG